MFNQFARELFEPVYETLVDFFEEPQQAPRNFQTSFLKQTTGDDSLPEEIIEIPGDLEIRLERYSKRTTTQESIRNKLE